MGRPLLHDADTREALLDAAEELLASGGPSAVSVRATADAVDTSTRAVYTVFGSKGALIEALAARGFDDLARRVNDQPITDAPLHDLVEVGLHGFREFAIGRPHLFRITFDRPNAEVFGQPDVNPALQRSARALLARVERALDTGRLVERPAIEIAFSFHSICQGLATNELSRLPPPVGASFWQMTTGMDMVAVWRTTLGAFVHGLVRQ